MAAELVDYTILADSHNEGYDLVFITYRVKRPDDRLTHTITTTDQPPVMEWFEIEGTE